MQITYKGTPNKQTRPGKPKFIVIHWFGSGTLESANTRFQAVANQVSAHYGVDGDRVWQWAKEDEVAYHCGDWQCNLNSIGIEHNATTSGNASDTTYATTIELIADICKRYNITPSLDTIKPHRAYKSTQCPGTIDLGRIVDGVKRKLNNEDMIERKYLDEVIRYDDSDKVYWHVPGPEAFDKYIKDWNLVKVVPRPVTIKEVPVTVTVEKIVEKEVIKEVPVDKIIEVPVETLSVGQLIGALLRKLIKG